jgi:zinc transport system ATP-binding protein
MDEHVSQEKIIELENISFAYGTEPVLRDINLAVSAGDYLGIIGPNGGGKTTLLKIMLGLLKVRSGTVRLFGKDINEFKEWSKIGYVPQKAANFELNFPATVEEIVLMGRTAKKGLFKMLNKEDRRHVSHALSQVGMREYKDRLISDLSGGQQQRVFIARALAGDPEVIFLDEPTVGVDIKTQEEFYKLLEKLNKEYKITLILVSHDIDVITNEVKNVACINQDLIYHGTSKEFIKEDIVEKMYGKGVKVILHNH